ncbi:hypothetical protein COCCADRAFT_100993 [Bipolaris zeicola 26-R-13]|uniref:Xylanolytic transcriptional activator regulatory domain-containing protein n=1 Tax=Cochliobolus carbonum (strain 26-R-13) TaxID=930089 RepID=W6YJS7_COCC2|nr:uncharacterized protein COCCADRAFT_100993 [Bipolaris zeicola 26-R-13]EUC31551.1 hypothetical protein COCCADRAFT_100993 [Bipolaris zeicola 26-R-13]
MYPVDAFIEAATVNQGISEIYHEAAHPPQALSNFFEQIMVTQSDFLATDYLHPSAGLTAWLPETDWLGEVDLFGADFMPAIDETFNLPSLNTGRVGTTTTPGGTVVNEARATNSGDAVRRRHAVFKQSPWFWIPESNQNAFSEQEGITLDERQVDLALSPHQPHASNVIIPGRLSQQSRDQILQLVLKTAPSQVTMSSFPSADCLDKLIKVGIAKRTEGDAWIHPYTFNSDTARPEFLTALVVAGCICFGIPSVNKTGLVLQEIVRVSLRELAEQDNGVMRDLQYLQACMLWLDIGAFCGFRRKMELAESSLQVLVTSLRRAGRFDDVRYSNIVPTSEDGVEELSRKWHQWVELESFKRLVYHLFEHDIYMTMVNHRQPLLSYAELTLPLPASESLWLAPSAEVWKARMMNMQLASSRPSMRSILQEPGSASCLHAGFDTRIAHSAYIHGLASQVWEHCQQSVLLHDMSDASSQLWSRSRQQKLHECIRDTNIVLDSSTALICVFQQFLQMYLFADLDTITRFAGRCGEEAAHRAYIALQPWCKSREARTAIAHAGQVLHAARAILPYQNRGQDSFIIYHSIMVLWTYSMITSDCARKTRCNTPTQVELAAIHDGQTLVFLDDARCSNQSAVNTFIMMNTGIPCLRISFGDTGAQSEVEGNAKSDTCDLRYPWQVMKAGVALLDATHPGVDRETGPPLIRALCGLMEDLGGLQSS